MMADEQTEGIALPSNREDQTASPGGVRVWCPPGRHVEPGQQGAPSPPPTEEHRTDNVIVRTYFRHNSGEDITGSGTIFDDPDRHRLLEEDGKAGVQPVKAPPARGERSPGLDDTQTRSSSRGRAAKAETRPHRPPPDKRKDEKKTGCRSSTLGWLLLALALVGLGSVAVVFALSGFGVVEIPLIDRYVAPLVSGLGGRGEAAGGDQPTATPTTGGLIEATQRPSLTETPPIGVTLLPTDQATPTPGATSVLPTQPPPNATAIPTALPAPTLTPHIVTDGEDIIQAGVPMVYVDGGSFEMGSQASSTQRPIHTVTLSPYYIDRHEVTNAQWAACVSAGACLSPASKSAYDGSPYYGVDAYDDYPVIFVNWYNADAYCRWRGARLPTEAEWEMAARWDPETGEVTVYPWGDEWDPARLNYCDAGCALGSYADPDYGDGWPQTAPVGSFPEGASAVGALDMAGNVAEWVADWFSISYYAVSPGENPTGPASGTLRVVRGGAWGVGSPALLTSATRSRFAPTSEAAGLGFRCAISADRVDR